MFDPASRADMTPILGTALAAAGRARILLFLGGDDRRWSFSRPPYFMLEAPVLFRVFGKKPLARLLEGRAEGRTIRAF